MVLSLSLGATRRFLISVSSLKIHLYFNFVTNTLETFTNSLGVGEVYVDVSVVVIVINVISPVSPGIVLGLISAEPVVDVNF